MDGNAERQIHYEVYSRRATQGQWTLEMASESRDAVMLCAAELLASGRGLSVRVTKETFDPTSNAFRSATLMTKIGSGTVKPQVVNDTEVPCASPEALYSPLAREKIGRLLEDWLRAHHVTPFELLHRPDLAEKLDNSGKELLHVAQKLSVPESHSTGQGLHGLIRRWSGLFDRACARLIKDGRNQRFPHLAQETALATIIGLADDPDRDYLLGGALAGLLAPYKRPSEKLMALLPLTVQLGDRHPWILAVIQSVVMEIFGARATLNDITGRTLDPGQVLVLWTRLTIEAPDTPSEVLFMGDGPLEGILGAWHDLIVAGHFPLLKESLSRRVRHELKGQRRLRPNSPEGEVETLRQLSCYMDQDVHGLYSGEDIDDAFYERSKNLVTADFLESLLRTAGNVPEEAEKIIWLCENVAGRANKRQIIRWLTSTVTASKFERYLRDGLQAPAQQAVQIAHQRLAFLAVLQKRVLMIGVDDLEGEDLIARLGRLGSLIADDVKLMAHIVKAPSSPVQKLSRLLNMATGQTAPLGPLAEKAKIQVLRLLRDPDMRIGLSAQPAALTALKPMMQAAGLAA